MPLPQEDLTENKPHANFVTIDPLPVSRRLAYCEMMYLASLAESKNGELAEAAQQKLARLEIENLVAYHDPGQLNLVGFF